MKIRRSVISLISDTEFIVFSGLNKIVDRYSCLMEDVKSNDFTQPNKYCNTVVIIS